MYNTGLVLVTNPPKCPYYCDALMKMSGVIEHPQDVAEKCMEGETGCAEDSKILEKNFDGSTPSHGRPHGQTK